MQAFFHRSGQAAWRVSMTPSHGQAMVRRCGCEWRPMSSSDWQGGPHLDSDGGAISGARAAAQPAAAPMAAAMPPWFGADPSGQVRRCRFSATASSTAALRRGLKEQFDPRAYSIPPHGWLNLQPNSKEGHMSEQNNNAGTTPVRILRSWTAKRTGDLTSSPGRLRVGITRSSGAHGLA